MIRAMKRVILGLIVIGAGALYGMQSNLNQEPDIHYRKKQRFPSSPNFVFIDPNAFSSQPTAPHVDQHEVKRVVRIGIRAVAKNNQQTADRIQKSLLINRHLTRREIKYILNSYTQALDHKIDQIEHAKDYSWRQAKKDLLQSCTAGIGQGLGQGFAQPIGQVIAQLLVEGMAFLKDKIFSPFGIQELQEAPQISTKNLREALAYYQVMSQLNQDTEDPEEKKAIQKMISSGILSIATILNQR